MWLGGFEISLTATALSSRRMKKLAESKVAESYGKLRSSRLGDIWYLISRIKVPVS